MLQKEELDL